MTIKTTAMAAGLAAIFAAGSALAQGAPGRDYQGGYQGAPPSQGYQGPPPGYQGSRHAHMHHHAHAVIALIKDEARAGRISNKEAALLEQKIKQLHAEKRAERQARNGGERGVGSPHGQQ